MVEMVHGRITADETTVVSTAAVLPCGKQMENYHISTFPGQSLSKSLDEVMELSQDRLLLKTLIITYINACITRIFIAKLEREIEFCVRINNGFYLSIKIAEND
jgi:hypothetical protein